MTPDEREFRNRRRDDGYRPRARSDDRNRDGRGYRPRDDRRPRGDRGSSEGRRSDGEHRRRDGGDRPRYRNDPRDDRGYRPRDGRRDGRRDSRRDYRDEPRERPTLTIPSEITEILHKGLDCEINGRSDLAQILYLHGASRLNGGCEKNLLRMMKEAGKDQFPTIRGRLKRECPEEIMPVFDYLCSTIDSDYDVSSVRTSAETGNIFAIHCLIRTGALEQEDALIDVYAKSIVYNPEIVTKGLETLARKSGSAKARKYLDDYSEHLRLRDSVKVVFPRAMKGENNARKELNRLADQFPEAKFLEGYLMAVKEGSGEEYLRKGARKNMQFTIPNLQNLNLADSPFSKYLKAKRLQVKGEQWIPAMVAAVKEGSDEAMDELEEVQNRRDVRKSLESYYLAKGDIDNLVRAYDGRDSGCLDKYCNGDAEKILKVGRMLGGNAEVDWLSKGYRKGCTECRDALVEIASDRRRHGKPLIYALHDTGAEMAAAKLYFEMLDDPSVPAVKWLQKVCKDEEAKEYIRSRFEEMNDLETFEYIFVDDGYVPRYQLKKERSQNRRRY